MIKNLKFILFSAFIMLANAEARPVFPACLGDAGEILPVNNAHVIDMQSNTPNGHLARARIKGKIGKIYTDLAGHEHFEAIIGPKPLDKIEVVYNNGFGALPNLKAGMIVEACGDYITSTAQTGPYPPSPNRAIIHYIHRSTNRNHLSGYTAIDGKLFGQNLALDQSNNGLNVAPQFKRIIMIVLENTDYQEALKQPFMSKIAEEGALFTNFKAETHPSQPNYIAMVAGDTLGVTGDSIVNLKSGKHIGNLLEEKGLSWKAYAEDYPGNCFLGKSNDKYVRKHLPFLSFKSVQNRPDQCAKVVNAKEMAADFSQNNLPNFSFYVPNMDNDGHDTSPAFSDRWLKDTFGKSFADPVFMKDTLAVITFDESESYFGNNQVYTVMLGGNIIPGSIVFTAHNHYSILKLIEEVFSLGTLGLGDSLATSITGIWQ